MFSRIQISKSFLSNKIGDEGPTKQEEGLFKISDLKTAKDVELANDQAPDTLATNSDSEEDQPKAKTVKYSKDKGVLDQDDLQYNQNDGVRLLDTYSWFSHIFNMG